MTVATKDFAPFQAQTIRATRVDACGIPVIGSKSTYVSDGIISVDLKAQTDSNSDVEVKNAKGVLMINQPGRMRLKWYDITITLTQVDPDLYEMFTGQQLVTDALGNAVGVRLGEDVPLDTGIGLETWTKVGTAAGNCSGTSAQYGYFVLPYLTNGWIGDLTLNDGAMSCVLTGRSTRNSGWGTGPYNVVDTAVSGGPTPGKLAVAIGQKDHLHMQITTIAPPANTVGAVALA